MKAKWFFVLTAWARQRMAAVRDYLRLEIRSSRVLDLRPSTTTLSRVLDNLPAVGYHPLPAWVAPKPGTTPRNVRRAARNGGCNGAD